MRCLHLSGDSATCECTLRKDECVTRQTSPRSRLAHTHPSLLDDSLLPPSASPAESTTHLANPRLGTSPLFYPARSRERVLLVPPRCVPQVAFVQIREDVAGVSPRR